MINMRHKMQKGFVLLALSLVVLSAVSIVTIFTARTVVVEYKIANNTKDAKHAFDAAQAGLDYGLVYLYANRATITDNQTVANTLANGSSYSAQFQFQGGNNTIVKVQVTGTSADGVATKIISQMVHFMVTTGNLPGAPIETRGDVDLEGNTEIINLISSTTIVTGSNHVGFDGNAETTLSGGTGSDSGGLGADVELNNTEWGSITDAEMQAEYLGTTIADWIAADYATMSPTATVYNSDHTISGSGTLGSPGNPVNIIVNGSLTVSGTVTIHGNLYATGGVTIAGGTINGNVTSNNADSANIDMVNGNNTVINGYVLSNTNIQTDGQAEIHGNVVATSSINLAGQEKIYGLVFSLGDVTSAGNGTVNGAIVSGGTYTSGGNGILTYDPDIIGTNNQQTGNFGVYAKIPGTWQDMNL